MKKILSLSVIAALWLSGCATVPTASESEENSAKEFQVSSPDNAGIYVYRINSPVGGALKKDVFIEGECIGETAPGVFFYQEVEGAKNHTVSTESEFSNNDLKLNTESGKLYFVEQFIKMGVFVGGAGLRQVDPEVGKQEVMKLNMATKGKCSS